MTAAQEREDVAVGKVAQIVADSDGSWDHALPSFEHWKAASAIWDALAPSRAAETQAAVAAAEARVAEALAQRAEKWIADHWGAGAAPDLAEAIRAWGKTAAIRARSEARS